MKYPGRFLRGAMDWRRLPWIASARAHPLLAAGSCVAAVLAFVLAFVLTGGSGGDTGKRAALPDVEAKSGDRPEPHAHTTDPARALAHAFTLGDRGERDSRVRDLLCAWAVRDAESALGWVAALEDPAARRSARSIVCFALAEKDPRQAVTLALAHGADGDDDRGLLECLTMQWCEKETGDVIDWAGLQPPGEWRERLLSRASFVLSKSDPAAAAQIVSDLEPGTVQDEAAMAVLHQWALRDSSAALRWADAFPEGNLRERALVEISNLRNRATSVPDVE